MSRRQKRKKRGSMIFATFMFPLLSGFIFLRILAECLECKKASGGAWLKRHRVKY